MFLSYQYCQSDTTFTTSSTLCCAYGVEFYLAFFFNDVENWKISFDLD